MEVELFALNFVRENPFFKKDAEKRMSASFCGSLSLVSETTVADPVDLRRRPLSINSERGLGVLSSASRSKSAFSLSERESQKQNPDTMVVEGTTVKLRRTDSTRRKEMAARRETVEILMEEIVRENRKSSMEVEAEERAASSGSDLEYGPGIVERLKAKFAKISTRDGKARQKHKRHRSVDDILEESVGGDYGTYERRSQSRELRLPPRSTQTLDRSPRHSDEMNRRTSRSMADLGVDDYDERRAFSLQRPSRREEYDREELERAEHRRESFEDNEEVDEDMVDIRELRKLFDRPAAGGAAAAAAPAPWRAEEARRERFIERGRTHQTVPPNVGDTRRDAPPPRDLRLSAPSNAPIAIDSSDADNDTPYYNRVVPLKKTTGGRRVTEQQQRPAVDEDDEESLPEFVKMARRLRRATFDVKEGVADAGAAPAKSNNQEPLAIVTSLPPADPSPVSVDSMLVSPPNGRRDSFTGAVADVSPPPEEPKPPMRPSDDLLLVSSSSTISESGGSRYSSLARSERSRTDSTSTHIPYSDLSLPRSDVSTASKVSKRSMSTEGGVRMGYVANRSTSNERRSNGGYARVTVPENQGTSGVEEMQRLLSKFGKRRPRVDEAEQREEEKEREAPSTRDKLLAEREAVKKEERGSAASAASAAAAVPTVVVLSPGPERRTRFVPAIVGIRSSDGRQLLSPTMTTGCASPTLAAELLHSTAPAVNVVSISVRDSAPSVIYTNVAAAAPAASAAGNQQEYSHFASTRRCDEDESDVRRSSVGSTASSSASSIADSLTSSGCSSSEDLIAEAGVRPQSLLPPVTPPRKESLEDCTPRKSLSARYLEERGRDYIVAPPTPDDNDSSMVTMMEKEYEVSYDLLAAAAAYNNSKPYGDEAITPPAAAAAAAPVATATWAPTIKVEEEEVECAAAAATDARCMPQEISSTECAPSSSDHLTREVCSSSTTQDVTIVEIDEEEIIEDAEEYTPEVRQLAPVVHDEEEEVQQPQPAALEMRQQYDDSTDSEVDTDDDGEIEDIANRQLRLSFTDMHSPQMAGDGNPIRHSIIHLAMEEDRPALLEAMSETYSFVFEDVDSERASTSSGIIKAPHKERRANMKRIVIEAEATGVYTYLDEQSAETEEYWRDGAAVTIQDYHSMVAAATAEAEAAYMRSIDELARWNASIAATDNTGSSDPISDLTSRHLVFST